MSNIEDVTNPNADGTYSVACTITSTFDRSGDLVSVAATGSLELSSLIQLLANVSRGHANLAAVVAQLASVYHQQTEQLAGPQMEGPGGADNLAEVALILGREIMGMSGKLVSETLSGVADGLGSGEGFDPELMAQLTQAVGQMVITAATAPLALAGEGVDTATPLDGIEGVVIEPHLDS